MCEIFIFYVCNIFKTFWLYYIHGRYSIEIIIYGRFYIVGNFKKTIKKYLTTTLNSKKKEKKRRYLFLSLLSLVRERFLRMSTGTENSKENSISFTGIEPSFPDYYIHPLVTSLPNFRYLITEVF